MQKVAEKWVYVAARAPNAKNPTAVLTARKIPKAAQCWILGLRGHNINNAAAAVIDYRTGEVLAYVGSASYTSKGNVNFQPQFDVLADGWRQPGSAIKPIDYVDRDRRQDADRVDDADGRRDRLRPGLGDDQRLHADPGRQARTRARSGSAPRSSSRSTSRPSRAAILTGLDRLFSRTQDFGLTYPKTAVPVVSMGIGTLEIHPIDLLGAYGTIADGGVRVPRRLITSVVDANGKTVWPLTDLPQKGTRVDQQRRRLRSSPTSWPATPTRRSTRTGASGRSTTARPAARPPTRPARRATTATSPPTATSPRRPTTRRPALAVGVWMGNSDNTPERRQASLDTSAPLWSAILTEISQGLPIADFQPPADLETATVDAFTGLQPGPFTTQTVDELFLPGTVPTQEETIRVTRQIDAASGLLWQDGCAGPGGQPGILRPDRGRCQLPDLAEGRRRVGRPRGAGRRASRAVRRGPGRRTSTTTRSPPSGKTWGAPFAPTELCPVVVPPPCDPLLGPCSRRAIRCSARASRPATRSLGPCPAAGQRAGRDGAERRVPAARDGRRPR